MRETNRIYLDVIGRPAILHVDTAGIPGNQTKANELRVFNQEAAELSYTEASVGQVDASGQGLEQVLTNGGEPVQPASAEQPGQAQAGL